MPVLCENLITVLKFQWFIVSWFTPQFLYHRAVYTGIKKPEFFSHSGFSLEVARQLPLNTAKKPESKNPPLGPFTLAKTNIQKTWVFCCTVYTARKTHNIRVFWHEKRMREKTRISYWCFGKWCACATSLYLWLYTCSAHYVAGRGRVIPLKVTYHVTKNPNNTLRDWSRRLHWQKKPWKTRGVSKIPTPEVGFSIRGFCSV